MRVAALDLGSNSFHALVADVRHGDRLSVVERAKRMPRIGEAIFRTGEITRAARRAAFRALEELVPVIERNQPDAVCAVATSAVREARNGAAFVAEVSERFDLRVRVVSGEEEARLAHAGACARLGGDVGRLTLFDLGGGSLEVVVGDGERVQRTASAPLGVLRAVVDRPLSDPATAQELRSLEQWARRQVAAFLAPVTGAGRGQVILCAGTARSVRSMAREMGRIPADGPGADRVSRAVLRYLIDKLAPMPVALRRYMPGLDERRVDLIVHGAVMLDAILDGVGADEAVVCRSALREGLILQHVRQSTPISRSRRAKGSSKPSVMLRMSA
jgi:exopolyphosphatase / guanosine-5'-triphosphate,3'-diphosphate pyrophosphatase